MLRLDKVIKPWKEQRCLTPHQPVWLLERDRLSDQERRPGHGAARPRRGLREPRPLEQEYAVKRLEAALKTFGPGFHVYQYLFKSNRPEIPFAIRRPGRAAAIDQRRKFFEEKRDRLFRSKSTTAFCSKARGRRPAWAPLRPALPRPCRGHRRTEGAVHEQQHEDAAALADRARPCAAGAARPGIRAAARRLRAHRGFEPQGQFRFSAGCSTTTTGALPASRSTRSFSTTRWSTRPSKPSATICAWAITSFAF